MAQARSLASVLAILAVVWVLPTYCGTAIYVSSTGSGTQCSQPSPCTISQGQSQLSTAATLYVLDVVTLASTLSIGADGIQVLGESNGGFQCSTNSINAITVLSDDVKLDSLSIVGCASGIYVSGVSNLHVQNVTVTGCTIGFSSTGSDTVFNSSSLVFNTVGMRLVSSSTLTGGAGMVVANNSYLSGGLSAAGLDLTDSTVLLDGVTIVNNTNLDTGGGGIDSKGASTVVISNSYIANNLASGTGGGILVHAGTITVMGSNFYGNSAQQSSGGGGGAISLSSITMSGYFQDSTFCFNTASNNGGAVAIDGSVTVVSFFNCSFSNNTAHNGGGIFLTTGNATFVHSHFTNNSVTQYGGAVFVNGGGHTTINYTTFAMNSAVVDGGAFYEYGSMAGYHELTNITVDSNSAKHSSVYLLIADIVSSVFSNNIGYQLSDQFGILQCATSCNMLYSSFYSNSAYSAIYAQQITMDSVTIIESGSVFITQTSTTSFSISNCELSGNSVQSSGGGLYINNANVTLCNITFEDNSAANFGGGLYLYQSNVIASNLFFSNNTANYGGGIAIVASNVYLRDTTILNNTARFAGLGGGISITQGGNVVLDNVVVVNNTCQQNDGGGVLINYAGYSGNVTINGGTISGNWAVTGGGLNSNNGVALRINGTVFANNYADGYGGGLFVSGSEFHATNMQVLNNYAASLGGGVYLGQLPGIPLTFDDCTFSNNSAFYHGGTIYLMADTYPIFTGGTYTTGPILIGGDGVVDWIYANEANSNVIFRGATINGNSSLSSEYNFCCEGGSDVTSAPQNVVCYYPACLPDRCSTAVSGCQCDVQTIPPACSTCDPGWEGDLCNSINSSYPFPPIVYNVSTSGVQGNNVLVVLNAVDPTGAYHICGLSFKIVKFPTVGYLLSYTTLSNITNNSPFLPMGDCAFLYFYAPVSGLYGTVTFDYQALKGNIYSTYSATVTVAISPQSLCNLNNICNAPAENCTTCPADCGPCPPPPPPPTCTADGTCNVTAGENCSTCPIDCGACSTTAPTMPPVYTIASGKQNSLVLITLNVTLPRPIAAGALFIITFPDAGFLLNFDLSYITVTYPNVTDSKTQVYYSPPLNSHSLTHNFTYLIRSTGQVGVTYVSLTPCPIEICGCGDGICDPITENCTSCSIDCTVPCACGDGVCSNTESCSSCALDCNLQCTSTCANCQNGGICGNDGVCNCINNGFSGADCADAVVPFHMEINSSIPAIAVAIPYSTSSVTTGPGTKRTQNTPSASSSTTIPFSVSVITNSLTEVQSNGATVSAPIYLQDVQFTAIPAAVPTGASNIFKYVSTLSNKATFNFTITVYNTAMQLQFANQTFNVASGDSKFLFEIGGWPFKSISNRLQLSLHVLSNITEEDCIDEDTNDASQDLWFSFGVQGVHLYGKFVEYGQIDNLPKQLSFPKQSSSTNTAKDYVISIPHFWNIAQVDPNYAMLLSSTIKPNTKCGAKSKKNNHTLAIALEIVIPVVVLVVVGIVIYLVLWPRIHVFAKTKEFEMSNIGSINNIENSHDSIRM